MSEREKKRQIAKISVFITSLFVIFLSVTYAFINQTLVGEKRQVITAGKLELELLEDENNLTIQDAMPMYDEVGMIQDAFTFRLKNKTATDTDYIMKLVDITTGEKLDTNIVKYGLTKDETNTIKFLSTLSDSEIDYGVIQGNQTINYSLRLWIDSKVEDQTKINGKSLSYRIDIVEGQSLIPKGTLKVFEYADFGYVPECNEEFCQNRKSVTSVVFENKIYIPDNITSDQVWDVSEEQDGSAMVYIEENGLLQTGNIAYKLHFQGENGVYANSNSNYLFSGFINLETIEGLEYFDTSKVTNMYFMFDRCQKLKTLDLSSFNTSNVTNMAYMFDSCYDLISLNVSNFDTSNVTDMAGMFHGCRSLTSLDVGKFNTFNVTIMSGMFYDCRSLTNLDLSSFNTSNVTNMSMMFEDCSSLTSLDVSNFDTSKVTHIGGMFQGTTNLVSLDFTNFDMTSLTSISDMFSKSGLKNLNLSNSHLSNIVSYRNFFRLIGNLEYLNLSDADFGVAENLASIFSSCKKLQNINLERVKMPNVTNMGGMFSECSSLISLDLSYIDTSKVTNMSDLFKGCSSLTNLDISHFNTFNVTNMFYMFSGCSSLTNLDISHFNTFNVIYMGSMFENCSSLINIDLSNLDVSNVTDIGYMFYGCSSLKSLNLGYFDTTKFNNYVTNVLEHVKSDCLIVVKDETMKNWILARYNYLKNIVVQSA